MERQNYLVGLHPEKSVDGLENSWLLLRCIICRTRMCGIVKQSKIQVYIWPLALPCMQSSTLGKDTPCPTLAAAHNPKYIFQNKWQHLQSNLRCPLQLVLLLKLPNANITIQVFSATLQVLLNMWKHLMYEWNQIRTQQFDGMARSQETARLKLCPSFEMPDNAKKEGKDFLVFFCCQIINHFCTKILVWSYFETLMRTRIVSTCTSKHSFMEAIKIVTVQSVVYILGKCVSAMRHIGMLFPLKIIFEVTMWVERNGSKHNSDVTAFLSCKECTDSKDDALFHITNIGNTRGRTLKLKLVLCDHNMSSCTCVAALTQHAHHK